MGLTSATIGISYQTSMSISGVMLDIKGRRNWMHYTPLKSIPVLEGMDQNFKIIQVTHHHTLHITTSRSSDDFLPKTTIVKMVKYGGIDSRNGGH